LTKLWTRAWGRFAAGVVLACGACGGDDGGGEDAAPARDGALPGDAGARDAAVVDCSGDHRESAEAANNPFPPADGSAERTGLSLAAGGAEFWLCGEIDPNQATGEITDVDAYEFLVAGDEPVDLRIEMVAAAGDTALGLDLFRVAEGQPQQVATVPFRNGYALLAGLVAEPGVYWVNAVARQPAPDSPIGYAISVAENQLACPASEQKVPDFVEAGDGEASRGNDTVAVHLPDPPALTAEEKDAAEATGLVMEPEPVRLVRGVSAAVESAGDSYLDRDAYLVATGPETSELELRLTWPDEAEADLDLYLFDAGDPEVDYSIGLGSASGRYRDALLTLNVDPDHEYWLWVGTFDLENGGPTGDVAYDVTLCARQHLSPVPPR
jgi:hypothetical protein